jgi:hypothetical protein
MSASTVIEKLKAIGYHLQVDGTDILLTAEREPPAELAMTLLAELKKCKAEAVLLLQNKTAAWPAEVQTLIEWFRDAPTPEAPFHLNEYRRVINTDLFYEALRRDILAGPRGARARTGALQDDLRELKNRLQ